ncbi:MAG: RNA-binding protein [Bacteroidales bacterium]|nr:RNA-binding protein [Bacteroidales bacterium]
MNIYVSNLSFNTASESLQELFAEYGEVTSAKIITDRETGRSRGFGFVEMSDDSHGENAIEELNDTDFEGKTINVNVARPRTERSNGGYNNNRGGGYGGYNRDRY